MSGIVL